MNAPVQITNPRASITGSLRGHAGNSKGGPRRRLLLAAAVLMGLTACAEKEFILPGAREDIREPELLRSGPMLEIAGDRALRIPAERTNADWAQGHGSPAFRTDNAALSASPNLIWSTSIGEKNSRKLRITATPVVADGRIYTLDANALVTAVAPDGTTLWTRDVRPARDDDGDATGGGMSYADGTLYVSVGFGELVALNGADGTVIWNQQLDATGSGRPTVSGGLVYLVAGDDTAWAVRTDNGRIAWQATATPSIKNVLGAPAPVVGRDLVYFAFGSGEILSTFRRGGLRRWSATVAGQRIGRATSRIGDITGAPVLHNRSLFAGNHSGRIVAFDAASGDRIWTAQEGALNPVWPAGDSIFAVSDRNQLLRLDAGSGDVIWAVNLPGFTSDKPRKRGEIHAHYGPVMAGGRLVVVSSDGLMRSFAPQNGALLGTVEIPDGASTGPAIAGGTLYVVSSRGELHAFR